MVASRKPRKTAASKRRRETLEEKFERVLAEPVGAPMKLTKREALYFLKRLAGSDPNAPSGDEVMRSFYGDWSEDADDAGSEA
jgi:hypothetical protein